MVAFHCYGIEVCQKYNPAKIKIVIIWQKQNEKATQEVVKLLLLSSLKRRQDIQQNDNQQNNTEPNDNDLDE
jgi:hypothetical protein